MSNDEILTDEHVAELLAKDAQDCSLKFSTMGMQAYRSDKKPANLPKPNTRFLRNVIKDTNTHNAALLKKEAAESQARLEKLERAEGRRNARPGDIRKRQIGSINAILGSKRRGGDESVREGRESRGRSSRRSRSRERGDRDRRRDRDGQEKRRSEEHDLHGRKRHRRDDSEDRRERDRKRSRSPSKRERRHRERSTSRHRHSESKRSDRRRSDWKEDAKPTSEKAREDSASESDPLDDFIGPAPPPKDPVRTRGRGTISAFSGIDRRFADDYDPRMDVEEEAPEGEEWSDAVEAFRDRQKLRAAREVRMKAAGFTEEEVRGLGEREREKTEADVRWSKAGEEREWDIGKGSGAE